LRYYVHAVHHPRSPRRGTYKLYVMEEFKWVRAMKKTTAIIQNAPVSSKEGNCP